MPRGATRWRDSMNGPDWMDLRGTMSAIGELHQCRVYAMLRPSGGILDAMIELSVVAERATPDPAPEKQKIVLWRTWPNKLGQTFEQTVYFSLLDLDNHIGREWYEQQDFIE